MRILICGGRDYSDSMTMYRWFTQLKKQHVTRDVITIIHGGAKGADSLANEWAKFFDMNVECYPADWDKHGKSAGPIRNKQMLTEGKPTLVVACPGGRGTQNMIKQAIKTGVRVVKITGEVLN